MRQLILALTFLATGAIAQEPLHYFTPIPGEGQSLRGAAAINDGAIGLNAKKSDGGYKIADVIPASPAEKSGIHIGDLITAIDEKPVAGVGQADFYRLLNKKPGDSRTHRHCCVHLWT